MSRNNLTLTVTVRKVSSGYRVTGFQMEDQNHAYSIARVLVRSPEYAGCYVVATDWNGETVFNIQAGSPEQQQAAAAPYQLPPNSAPAQYAPQYAPPPPPPPPAQYTGHPHVIAAPRPPPGYGAPPPAWGAPQQGNPYAPIPRALPAPAAAPAPIPLRALPGRR